MTEQTWYHGTTRERARSILRDGLTARYYGVSHGKAYNVLALHRRKAQDFGVAVIEVRIPAELAAEYLTGDPAHPDREPWMTGINKPIPPGMVTISTAEEQQAWT